MKNILLLFFIQLFNVAWPVEREIPILRVISEPDDNSIYSIFLILDSNGEILKLKRQWSSNNEIYEFKKIIDGTVILSIEKKEVLFMECSNCDFYQGGEIMIRFLKNGITNQYSEIFIDLVKKNDRWGFYDVANSALIKTLVLKSNKLLGKVIGIKEIEINPR